MGCQSRSSFWGFLLLNVSCKCEFKCFIVTYLHDFPLYLKGNNFFYFFVLFFFNYYYFAWRKYAPKCNACNELIIPKEDGTDSYNVECLGRSYHEYCYRCQVCSQSIKCPHYNSMRKYWGSTHCSCSPQVCGIQLSPEPNERGCYPLDGKILCKSCHLNLISSEGHNY